MIDRYAVVGHPIAHSQSPAIHAAFAVQTQQPVQYSRLLSPLNGFAQTIRTAKACGMKGVNVTVPFKFEAFAMADKTSARARLAKAANTLLFHADGSIEADNTDGAGLVWDIQNAIGSLAGKRILLVGAGGAAAGVLPSLADAGIASLILLNRTPDKATALIDAFQSHGSTIPMQAGSLNHGAEPVDVIINATSSALAGQSVPLAADWFQGVELAYDMMYGKSLTPFLAHAQQQGVPVRDGLGMLVGQAAEAFFRWRGVRPDASPVLASLRARLSS